MTNQYKYAIVAVAFGALALPTQALTISPGSELVSQDAPNSPPEIFNWIAQNTSYVLGVETYKVAVDGNDEEGDFKDNYSTSFNGDHSAGTISWDGPSFISNAEYLLVKDGNHSPAWYLFSLAGWDGQEDIALSGFWPGNGSISHVAIFGSGTSVPDGGATAALLGLGMAGLAVMRRKR